MIGNRHRMSVSNVLSFSIRGSIFTLLSRWIAYHARICVSVWSYQSRYKTLTSCIHTCSSSENNHDYVVALGTNKGLVNALPEVEVQCSFVEYVMCKAVGFRKDIVRTNCDAGGVQRSEEAKLRSLEEAIADIDYNCSRGFEGNYRYGI